MAPVLAISHKVIAVTLYNTKMRPEALQKQKIVMEKELEIPVIAPLQDGVDDLYDEIVDYISRYRDGI